MDLSDLNIHSNTTSEQHRRILAGLRKYGSMTTYEMERILNISRVATRVFELRQKGYKIESHREIVYDNFGRKHARVARYWLANNVDHVDGRVQAS